MGDLQVGDIAKIKLHQPAYGSALALVTALNDYGVTVVTDKKFTLVYEWDGLEFYRRGCSLEEAIAMTPEQFDEVLANLSAGFYVDADTLRRFVAEAARLRAEVDRLRLENEQLKFIYLEDAKSIGALVGENERLRAELAERERQITALGKARLSGLGE